MTNKSIQDFYNDCCKSIANQDASGLENGLAGLKDAKPSQNMLQSIHHDLCMATINTGWIEGLKVAQAFDGSRLRQDVIVESLDNLLTKNGEFQLNLPLLKHYSENQDKITPEAKAWIGFYVAPFLSPSDWDQFRASGLINTSQSQKLVCDVADILHGVSLYTSQPQSEMYPERVAELLLELPHHLKIQAYNEICSEEGNEYLAFCDPKFIIAVIKDDDLFNRKDVRNPRFDVNSLQLSDSALSIAMLDRHLLNGVQQMTALINNRENTEITLKIAENMKDLGDTFGLDGQHIINEVIKDNKARLPIIRKSMINSDDPTIKANGMIIVTQLAANIRKLEARLTPSVGMSI
jgi:hypothetical protein